MMAAYTDLSLAEPCNWMGNTGGSPMKAMGFALPRTRMGCPSTAPSTCYDATHGTSWAWSARRLLCLRQRRAHLNPCDHVFQHRFC
jgi:hypothetical protein